MSVIILQDKWRRQPSGLVTVDAANGLARGLFSFVTSAGGVARDLQAGINAQLSADAKVSPTVAGLGVTLDGTGDYASAGAYNKGNFFFSAGQSVFFEIVPAFSSASNTRQGVIHFANGTASGDIPRLRVIWLSASSGFYVDTKDGYAYSAAPSFAAGDVVRGIFTRTGINGGQWQFFNRGATSTKVADSGDGYAFSGADPSLYLGWDAENASWVMAGSIITTAAWSRGLSTGEAQAVLENPYQLLRKQPRILYFNVAGGGATIAGDSGSYTLSGTDASLKAGRKLAADSGAYALTGTGVAFRRGYALSAATGSYTVSGTAVSLKAGRKLAADSGSYTLTGTDAALTYSPAGSYTLTAESGSYSLTGTAATLKVSRKLAAESGTYALTGTAAGLAKGIKLTAESGSYTLTGSNVAFARTYVLTAESGAYTLTGTSAGLTWSGAPVVEVPTNGGPSIYGKPVFREKQFRKEYEEQVKRIEDEKRLARILREDEEITVIMALMAA